MFKYFKFSMSGIQVVESRFHPVVDKALPFRTYPLTLDGQTCPKPFLFIVQSPALSEPNKM